MPNERDIELDKYGITANRFRELKYLCLQYKELKAELESCYSLDGTPATGMPRGNATSNPTANKGERAERISRVLAWIEQTAIEAAGERYKHLLMAVTEGLSWASFDNPYVKNDFYQDRRKFFYILDKKRG